MVTGINPQDIWLIHDRGKNHGPISWNEVLFMVNKKQISNRAFIKNQMWSNWVPITYYFHPAQLVDAEIMGLIPSRYDALLYAGFGLFFFGLFGLFIHPILGLALLILSPIVEIYAIILERQNRPRAVTSTLGNIFAMFWIVIQIFATVFLTMALIGN